MEILIVLWIVCLIVLSHKLFMTALDYMVAVLGGAK